MAKRDPRLAKHGLSGFNKPKRTPGHPKKSHVVLAKEGDQVKVIGLFSPAVREAMAAANGYTKDQLFLYGTVMGKIRFKGKEGYKGLMANLEFPTKTARMQVPFSHVAMVWRPS